MYNEVEPMNGLSRANMFEIDSDWLSVSQSEALLSVSHITLEAH